MANSPGTGGPAAKYRELRLRHKVTLDQLALAGRFCGLPWTTGHLGDYELARIRRGWSTLT